jgi:hypothetical protein
MRVMAALSESAAGRMVSVCIVRSEIARKDRVGKENAPDLSRGV